jgi:hypothetical protein
MDVAVSGGKAFIASETFGLSAVNVVNPRAPGLMGSADIPFSGINIAVSGGRAVVIGKAPEGRAFLQVLDVTIPEQPRVLGELSTTIPVNTGTGSGFYDVALNSAGTLAVVAAGTTGVMVVDISNPATPVVRSTYNTPGWAYGVTLNSTTGLVYVADGNAGLAILNISNPGNPTLVGSMSMSWCFLADIAVSGGIAYLADSQGSLEVVDVSTPSAPRWVSLLQLSGGAYHVAVEGTRAVLITEGSSSWLDIIDIAQPSNPVKISSVVLGTPGTGKGVTLTNGLAYVAASGKGLQIYDVSTATPSLRPTAPTIGAALDVAVKDSYAYVADFPATISIISLISQ